MDKNTKVNLWLCQRCYAAAVLKTHHNVIDSLTWNKSDNLDYCELTVQPCHSHSIMWKKHLLVSGSPLPINELVLILLFSAGPLQLAAVLIKVHAVLAVWLYISYFLGLDCGTLGLSGIWKRFFVNVENITPECIGAGRRSSSIASPSDEFTRNIPMACHFYKYYAFYRYEHGLWTKGMRDQHHAMLERVGRDSVTDKMWTKFQTSLSEFTPYNERHSNVMVTGHVILDYIQQRQRWEVYYSLLVILRGSDCVVHANRTHADRKLAETHALLNTKLSLGVCGDFS